MKTVLFFLVSFSCFSQIVPQIDSILSTVDASDINDIEQTITALNWSRLRRYEKGEAKALHKMGYMYFSVGNYPKAIEKYLEAVSVVKLSGESEREAHLYINIAAVYDVVGRYNESVLYAHRGIDKTKSDTIKAAGLNLLGKGYLNKGEYYRGVFYSIEAVKLNEIVNRKAVKINLNNIAHAFYRNKEYTRSIEYLNRIPQYTHDGADLARMCDFKGCCFHQINMVDSAIFYYEKSVSYYPTASAFLNYAELLHKKGNVRRSREKIQIAIGLKPDLKHLHETLFKVGDLENSIIVRDCLDVKSRKDYELLCKESLEVAKIEKQMQIKDNEILSHLNTDLEKKVHTYDSVIFWSVFISSIIAIFTYCKYFREYPEEKKPFIFFKK